MQELRFVASPHDCTYLPGRSARMAYRIRPTIESADYEELLSRGWRRFGQQIFRPVCAACAECRSLRIRAPEFSPGKTQRRVLRKNQDLSIHLQRPQVSDEYLDLYRRYHAFMTIEKGWPEREIDAAEYAATFLGNRPPFAYEFNYRLGGELVAVGLVDLLPTAGSSIYFYHAPEMRERSLGVFSLLTEIQFAATRHLPHHYLGYWVPECPSMAYKADYRPFELLLGYPTDEEEPRWVAEGDFRPIMNPGDPGVEI